MERKLLKILSVVLISTLIGCGSFQPVVTAESFRKMSGAEIYALVQNSDRNWLLTSYDLITPENAKEAIVLSDDNGQLRFNLTWPRYGGFIAGSIASIRELSGKLDVSRIGSDGGHSMSFGKNKDGSYPDNSQRSLPKTSAILKTGVLDVDRYNRVVKAIVGAKNKENGLPRLVEIGYGREIAGRFLSEYDDWFLRDEVSGRDNIGDGAKSVGHTVDDRYGYYGVTAPWRIGDLDMKGGSGQLDTVFSWGLLCDSGLISNTGTTKSGEMTK